MPTGFEDFGSYEAGSLPVNMTRLDTNTTNCSTTVEELANSLSGKALRFRKVSGAGTQGGLVKLDDIPDIADGEFVCLIGIAPEDPVPPADNGEGCLHARLSASPYDFSGLLVESGGEIMLGVYGNDNAATYGSGRIQDDGWIGTSQAQTIAGGERWWVRMNMNGTAYKFRWWLSTAEEPGSWNVDVTQAAAPVAAGGFAFSGGSPNTSDDRSWFLEGVGWSDDPGVAAPTEASGGGGGGGSNRGRGPSGRRRSAAATAEWERSESGRLWLPKAA